MPLQSIPATEAARLEALRSYEVLDTEAEQCFDRLVQLAARLTGSPTAMVSLVDADRQWFKSRFGTEARQTPRDISFCTHAILTPDQPFLVADATRDPRFAESPLVTGPMGVRAYAGIPLVNPEGHALGTLCVVSPEPRRLTAEMIDTLQVLADAVMSALELRRTLRATRMLALTDALTGLPNRPAFLFALAQAIARQRRDARPFTVLYLDLDGLKHVNDHDGHAAGDAVLSRAGAILRTSLRIEDTPARVGGDEFAAVLVGGDGSEAQIVAERVRHRIEETMREKGWPVTASIGSVTYVDPPRDENAALAVADLHMYAAKQSGRNRVVSHNHISLRPPPTPPPQPRPQAPPPIPYPAASPAGGPSSLA